MKNKCRLDLRYSSVDRFFFFFLSLFTDIIIFILNRLPQTIRNRKRECRTRRQGNLDTEKKARGNKHQQIWIKSMKSSCREPENHTKFTKLFLPSHCFAVIIASFWPAHISLPPANGLAFFNTSVFLAKMSTNPLGLDSSNMKSIRMMLKHKNKGGKKIGRMRYDIFDMKREQKKSEAGKEKIGEKPKNEKIEHITASEGWEEIELFWRLQATLAMWSTNTTIRCRSSK